MTNAAPTTRLPEELQRGTKAYDLFAALPLVIFFGMGASVRLRTLYHQLMLIDFLHPKLMSTLEIISNLGALILAAMFIFLLFTRKPPRGGVRSLKARIAALAATFLSLGILMLPPRTMSPAMLVTSTLLVVIGIGFSIYSLGWLGRSFSIIAEARELVTGGPYAIVRHPLYLGEEIALIGVTLQFFSVWAVAILVLQIGFQIYRMGYEEGLLEEIFPNYSSYKARVARILPGIY